MKGYKLRSRLSRVPMNKRSITRARLGKQPIKPWRKRLRPSRKTRERVKRITKNKTLRTGMLGAAAVGTAALIIPKETIGSAADTVQKLGENVYDIGTNMGNAAGSLIKAVGVSADVLSNGFSFVSKTLEPLLR